MADAGRVAPVLGIARTAVARGNAATGFFLGSAALALGVLLASAAHPYALWPNRSDDFFYYLVLVRHSVLDHVVSADGLRPTNGFHPLYFLTLRAIYPWVREQALPGIALTLLAIAHVATGFVLWSTLKRLTSPMLAGVIAAVYVTNLAVLRIVFAAVETPLMVLCLAVCLWAHLRRLERGGRGDRVLALVALGLAVAARTDVVFLALAMALAPALDALRSRDIARAARTIDPAPLLVAAIPIVAFGVWGRLATGEAIQTSGRALSFWQSVGYGRMVAESVRGLGAASAVAAPLVYGLMVVGQFIVYVLRAPFELLAFHPVGWLLALAALAAWLARGASSPLEIGAAADARDALRRTLVLFQLMLWVFYALAFRHGQIWYWHGSLYVAALLLATVAAPLRTWLASRRTIPAFQRAPGVAGAIAVVLALGVTWLALGPVHPRPWVRDPRPVVPEPPDPLRRVPDGAVLGAFDTGQLGWEEPRLQVVNLDGLVNNAAYRALRDRRIGEWMIGQRIEWLYVNDVVVRRFRPFGLDAWLERAEPIGRSSTGTVLYRLSP
jgi:hypothetical protein